MPAQAAWRHLGARAGFEVMFARPVEDGHRFEGCAAVVEDGEPWAAEYVVLVDAAWVTRRAEVTELTSSGSRRLVLEHDGTGRWRLDGAAAPALRGCLDVDLETSAFTNALPVNRLALEVGAAAEAPAATVAAPGLSVSMTDQRYERRPDTGGLRAFAYAAPALGFAAELHFDASGLIVDYPGLATRAL